VAELITEAELDEMRAAQEEALPSFCKVFRYTSVPDGAGGRTNAKAYVDSSDTSPWPCRVASTGFTEERIYGDRIAERESFRLYLPYAKRNLITNTSMVEFAHDLSGPWTGKFEVVDVVTGGSWQTVTRAVIAAI
jgi:hypothetical protein